jgi:very-short-patch-repair endonuclease
VAAVARRRARRRVQAAGAAGDRYIADFFAPSVGLVVEVDGGVHSGNRAADRRRDEKLWRLGYCIVRVDAALVLRNVEAALAVISAALA